MSYTDEKPVQRGDAIAGIRLFAGGGHWLATPPPNGRPGTPPAFHPFVLPRLPRLLVDWLITCGGRVWHDRQRCMAALLLLDCRGGGGWWTIRLPRQRCGPDAACWSARRADLDEDLAPSLRLGGTFQTVATAGGGQALDAVPAAADGVHLVLRVGNNEPAAACCFIRAGGPVRPIRGEDVVADDWGGAIELAMPRLRLV